MEFRVDITGDTSGADKGAAALRAEAAAARATTAELEKLQKAHKDVGSPAPVVPTQPAAPAKPPPQPKAPDYKAGSFSEGHEDNFKPSPWAQEAAGAKAAAQAAKGVADEQTKGGQEAVKAGASSAKAAAKTKDGAKDAALGLLDLAKGSVLAGAALAGIQSIGDLGKLAIGWRGLAQLQMISYRAQMDIRRLVQGTDAQPLIRATAQLEKNLSKSTVTGDALSGILTRGFGSAFQAIEKLEPVAEAVLQGMVLGGLEAEIAWQNIKAAVAPVTVALEDAIGDVDGIGSAANGVDAGFKAVGATVVWVAGGIRDAYTAARDLNAEVKKLTGGTSVVDALRSAATGGLAGAKPAEGPKGGAAAPNPFAGVRVPSAKELVELVATGGLLGGQDTGKAIAAGMVKGMDDGSAAVRAAGEHLGKEGVAGANTGAEVHSPSKATARTAGFMIDGAVDELDRGAPDVARAAERAFVPPAAKGSAGDAAGAAGGAGAGTVFNLGPFNFPSLTSGKPDDIRAAVADGARAAIREACIKLGIPIPGGT